MIWLIGAGSMSVDYVKVLKAQSKDFAVIGRGQSSAESFEMTTGVPVIAGGLHRYLTSKPDMPNAAIVSVGVEQLFHTTKLLLDYGVKHILVEKPGGISFNEVEGLKSSADMNEANLFIAYNRRFYSSVIKAQELIEKDGGVTSFNFELTEWSHVIEKLEKKPEVFATWFLGNSTHVADLAFFLGGKPDRLSSYTSGALEWHPAASVFSGAGISVNGALFCYAANWESAGRWSVEILTKEHRYIFRPMEQLQIQKRGQIGIELVEVDDSLDKEYKPGLYKQVEAFLGEDIRSLCSLEEQYSFFPFYEKMAGYKA